MAQAARPSSTGRALTRDDLNVTVNHEPRIMDIRLAEALGFERPRKIREIIQRHMEALEKFGEVVVDKAATHGGTRPTVGRVFFLNKKQALYLCTKSETARATEITIEIVELYDAHTSGEPALPAPKRVKVREHERALPKPDEPEPAPFAPGSDLLLDLNCALMSANWRVEHGKEPDFGKAMKNVIQDLLVMRLGQKPAGMVFDWNWKRGDQRRRRAKKSSA